MDIVTSNAVQKRRNVLKMTQQDLAYKSGVSLSTVVKLENGAFSPRLTTARAMARVLGCHVDDLWPDGK